MIESGHACTHPNDASFSWSMPGIEPLNGNPCDMRQRYKKHVFTSLARRARAPSTSSPSAG
eukprot:9338222-Alexandrium_andersonii.AAC.1